MFSDVTHTTSRAPLSAAVFRAAWIGAALALAAVVVANAWVCDDAFITLRTIDNLVHGHGLRWNADERVQVFTHPLWLLVLAPFYAITREPYYTTLAVSIAASAGALWLTLRAAPPLTTAAVLLSLAACRTFVDFATSGLESPLLFVLLALLGSSPPPAAAAARAGRTLWLTSLAVLTRPDAALLFAPALVRDLGAARGAPGRWRALSGLAPLLAWELFSLLYYGSLLPNTAFAKLGTGASWSWSLAQGAAYFASMAAHDPAGLLLLVACAIAVALDLAPGQRAVALGALLHCAYVVVIGGDFMAGRFLAPAIFVAAAVVARVRAPAPVVLGCAAAIVAFGFTAASPTFFAASAKTTDWYAWDRGHGIVDERLFYSGWAGLRHVFPGRGLEGTPRAIAGADLRRAGGVRMQAAVGYVGYYAGPAVHLFDLYALTDPLLARLPARADIPQRIGHFMRAPPAGYFQTLETGEDHLDDPSLRRARDDLALATRGPVFAGSRLAAVARLLFSRAPLKAGAPPPQVIDAKAVAAARAIRGEGVVVSLPPEAQAIELELDANDSYHLLFTGGERGLRTEQVEASTFARGQRQTRRFELNGSTRLLIFPYEGDGQYTVGPLLVLP